MTGYNYKETFWVEIERNEEGGPVLSEAWRSVDGQLHRTDRDQPAVRKFSEDTGVEEFNLWCCNGKFHRDGDKPAMIHRSAETGSIVQETWYINGVCCRDDERKPVSVSYDAVTGEVKKKRFKVGGKEIIRTTKPKPA